MTRETSSVCHDLSFCEKSKKDDTVETDVAHEVEQEEHHSQIGAQRGDSGGELNSHCEPKRPSSHDDSRAGNESEKRRKLTHDAIPDSKEGSVTAEEVTLPVQENERVESMEAKRGGGCADLSGAAEDTGGAVVDAAVAFVGGSATDGPDGASASMGAFRCLHGDEECPDDCIDAPDPKDYWRYQFNGKKRGKKGDQVIKSAIRNTKEWQSWEKRKELAATLPDEKEFNALRETLRVESKVLRFFL